MLTRDFHPRKQKGGYQIHLDFRSGDKRFASAFRHFISSYTNLALKKKEMETPFNVGMIADELMQNALAYSKEGTTGRLELEFSSKKIRFTTLTVPQKEERKELSQVVEKLQANSEDFYLSQVQEVEESQLGLARIVHDFGCQLKIDLAPNKLTLTATYPLE